MVAGGERLTTVEILTPGMSEPPPECQDIADFPFYTKGAVGLINKDNQAMICGGSSNPDKRSCYTYDNVANQWVLSNTTRLLKPRDRGTTVRVGRGYNVDYWIIGGTRPA